MKEEPEDGYERFLDGVIRGADPEWEFERFVDTWTDLKSTDVLKRMQKSKRLTGEQSRYIRRSLWKIAYNLPSSTPGYVAQKFAETKIESESSGYWEGAWIFTIAFGISVFVVGFGFHGSDLAIVFWGCAGWVAFGVVNGLIKRRKLE